MTSVDDPDGPLRLVSVLGPLDGVTIWGLLDAIDDLDGSRRLHLDLSRAPIVSSGAIRCLEHRIDDLERRGVHLRVVGVDPHHPALVPTTL